MYSIDNPPDWLKNLPKGAIRIGVEVFNQVLSKADDEDRARMAAWSAIKAKYEKADDGQWQPKAAVDGSDHSQTIRVRAARQADDKGLVWEVVIIAPGLSSSTPRMFWEEEVLKESIELLQGVDVNAYELTADFFSHLPVPDLGMLEDIKRYLVAKKVGWIEKAWWEDGIGIKGTIHFLPDQSWLPNALEYGKQHGNDDVLGLSIDAHIKGVQVNVDGWTVVWVLKIHSYSSVDVVTYPAAGGRFLRAVAALNNNTEGKRMDREKLLQLIEQKRPDLLQGKVTASLADDEIFEMARQAMEPVTVPDPGAGDQRGAQGLTLEAVQALIKNSLKDVTTATEQRAACARLMDKTLNESNLPRPARHRIERAFEGKVFEQSALDAAIKEEKDYLAQMAGPGDGAQAPWGDQTRVSMGLCCREKVQMAVDKLFGLTEDDLKKMARMSRLDNRPVFEDLRVGQAEEYSSVPAPTGIRELYVLLSGDTEVSGRFYRDRLPADLRAAQDINSSTFTYLLGNTLGRRMVKDYLAVDYQENLLISIRKPVKDFRQQEAVNVGYFGDIDTVDPETNNYQEISAITDEESPYTLIQKGNILTFSRKFIINDDVSIANRVVNRVNRALRRTHGKYVWDFWRNNADCSDGTAWFTNPHGNLQVNALGFAAALAQYIALGKMTEKDSGERIAWFDGAGVKPTLIYPIDLVATAESIISDEFYYTGNDLTTKTRNPLRGKINGAQVSLLTDATDWGLLMPADVVDIIEMGYLNGRQEPEFFVADAPQSEQMFVADQLRYKFRHEYAGAVIDYRSGTKNVVAG